MRPWPRHVGHHPRGELKEKCLGSSSGKDSPLATSVRVVENQERTSPVGVSRKQAPLPSLSASARVTAISFGDLPLRSATTTSISCSLYRSSLANVSTRSRRP